MERKAGLEFVLLLSFVALGVGYLAPRPEGQPSPRGPFTVNGLQLGMSRADVTRRFGRAQEERPGAVYTDLTEAKFSKEAYFPNPKVTYSSQSLVVQVASNGLEWPGGALKSDTSLARLRRLFPELIELHSASAEPAWPGEYYWPKQRLKIFTEVDGMFATEHFWRAELSVPYYSLVPRATWASRMMRATYPGGLTAEELRQAQSVGCYHCQSVIFGPREFGRRGQCPRCGYCALMGLKSTEIASVSLGRVHAAWFEP
jgi:hypothetical protein